MTNLARVFGMPLFLLGLIIASGYMGERPLHAHEAPVVDGACSHADGTAAL